MTYIPVGSEPSNDGSPIISDSPDRVDPIVGRVQGMMSAMSAERAVEVDAVVNAARPVNKNRAEQSEP
jgi:hypothetical protein